MGKPWSTREPQRHNQRPETLYWTCDCGERNETPQGGAFQCSTCNAGHFVAGGRLFRVNIDGSGTMELRATELDSGEPTA